MDFKALNRPLKVSELDFRVQSINSGGYATLLVYKDARVDMAILDEVVGPMNWKREHTRDNKNCIVSIWDDSKSQWVSKEDTGTESATEAEKGLASDSFKRACFNWGIGRCLYSFPQISVKLVDGEYEEKAGKLRQTYKLQLKSWTWNVEYSENGEPILLVGTDNFGKERFRWPAAKPAAKQQPTVAKTKLDEPLTPISASVLASLKEAIVAGRITSVEDAISKAKQKYLVNSAAETKIAALFSK